ncbi:MAG: hypothetical protein ACP5IF_07680, partial [Conexivisphaera sp.]
TPRSIELVIRGDGTGEVVASGPSTVDVLESVYGHLDTEPVDPRAQAVEFLRELAARDESAVTGQ